MAAPVVTDDSYATPRLTVLRVGQSVDFVGGGNAATVNITAYAGQIDESVLSFTEGGTRASLGLSAFPAVLAAGFTQRGFAPSLSVSGFQGTAIFDASEVQLSNIVVTEDVAAGPWALVANDGYEAPFSVSTDGPGLVALPTGFSISGSNLVYDETASLTPGTTTHKIVATALAQQQTYDANSLQFQQNTSGNWDYGRRTVLPTNFGAGEFTYEVWVKANNSLPVGSTASNTLVNWASEDPQPYSNSTWWYRGNFLLDGHNNGNVSNGTFSLQFVGGGRVRWSFGDGSAAAARTGGIHAVQAWPSSGTPSLLDGLWHKITCVRRWDGGTGAILELWIDGTLVASTTTTLRTNMATSYWSTWPSYGSGQEGWFFGAEKFAALGGADWEDYKGLVGYETFYTRAKTSAELSNDWADEPIVGATGLAGLYRFNEGTGTTVAPAAGTTGGNISLFNTNVSTWSAESIFPPVPDAEADWLARSTAAGVVFTERFDSLQIGPGAGGGRYYNGDYGQRGFLDTTGPRVSGVGSLRLERRAGENFANATGRYSRDTVDGGSLLPQYQPGDVFYVQFRYRINQNWYDNQPVWGSGGREACKVILLHSDNISCGQIEISLQPVASWFSNRLLRMYTGCGSPGFFTETTSPNNRQTPAYLWQQRWDIDSGSPWQKVPGYELAYGSGSSTGGLIFQPNTWYTIDFRVQLPSSWGASNCRIEAWATEAGQTERQKFIAWIGPMDDNGPGETNRMNNLTLTGYLSGGSATASTDGSCWYDEVIVSNNPIALPAALPVSP